MVTIANEDLAERILDAISSALLCIHDPAVIAADEVKQAIEELGSAKAYATLLCQNGSSSVFDQHATRHARMGAKHE